MLPKKRQTLLFSATFSNEIRKLASDFLINPEEIQVTPRNSTVDLVEQFVYPVDKRRKRELLSELIGKENWQQVLVFARTKHGANRLAEQLTMDGIQSTAIHGNKSQTARTKALASFKAGKVRVLVATDIAARGIDIDKLPHVVNYDLPHVPEDYVHRIGRTARAGREGQAISLVCVDEKKLLADIEKLLKTKIDKVIVPGYEVDPRLTAEPIVQGRQQRSKRPQGGRNYSGGRNQNAGRNQNQARRGKPGAQRKRSGGGNRRAS
jgi:ATP-dependent RNA helicase RhlE